MESLYHNTDTSQHSATKFRKKYRSNFLTNLFRVLDNEEFPDLIRWNDEGTHVELLRPNDFAAYALPKMYKHSKLTSFTKQLNMYQFQRTSPSQKYAMVFYHPLFQRGRRDLMLKIDRQRVVQKEKTAYESQIDDTYQEREAQCFKVLKKPRLLSDQQLAEINWLESSLTQSDEIHPNFSEVSIGKSVFTPTPNQESKKPSKDEISSLEADFRLLVQIASNSKGNIEGTHNGNFNLPDLLIKL